MDITFKTQVSAFNHREMYLTPKGLISTVLTHFNVKHTHMANDFHPIRLRKSKDVQPETKATKVVFFF